jgi:hypothetical protein
MNLQEMKQAIRSFAIDNDIDLSSIKISAGAALLLLGGRTECTDIDVSLPPEHFIAIRDKTVLTPRFYRTGYIDVGVVSCHLDRDNVPTITIDGFTVYSLSALIQQKEYLCKVRDKPQDVIDLQYLTDLPSINPRSVSPSELQRFNHSFLGQSTLPDHPLDVILTNTNEVSPK